MCKALGHPHRFEILKFLLTHPGCITGNIVDHLPISQATTSQHLAVLKEAGWIRGTVSGPATCYCLDAVRIGWFKELVGRDPVRTRLPTVLAELPGVAGRVRWLRCGARPGGGVTRFETVGEDRVLEVDKNSFVVDTCGRRATDRQGLALECRSTTPVAASDRRKIGDGDRADQIPGLDRRPLFVDIDRTVGADTRCTDRKNAVRDSYRGAEYGTGDDVGWRYGGRLVDQRTTRGQFEDENLTAVEDALVGELDSHGGDRCKPGVDAGGDRATEALSDLGLRRNEVEVFAVDEGGSAEVGTAVDASTTGVESAIVETFGTGDNEVTGHRQRFTELFSVVAEEFLGVAPVWRTSSALENRDRALVATGSRGVFVVGCGRCGDEHLVTVHRVCGHEIVDGDRVAKQIAVHRDRAAGDRSRTPTYRHRQCV